MPHSRSWTRIPLDPIDLPERWHREVDERPDHGPQPPRGPIADEQLGRLDLPFWQHPDQLALREIAIDQKTLGRPHAAAGAQRVEQHADAVSAQNRRDRYRKFLAAAPERQGVARRERGVRDDEVVPRQRGRRADRRVGGDVGGRGHQVPADDADARLQEPPDLLGPFKLPNIEALGRNMALQICAPGYLIPSRVFVTINHETASIL